MTRNQEPSSRKRSIAISVVASLALLVLALTVFAVASQARSLSNQAEQAVQTVENLRVVSLSRVELSVASRFAENAPEQTLVIQGAIENSLTALDAVEGAVDESTTEEVRTALAEFRVAVDAQVAQIDQPTQDLAALSAAEVATGESFSALGEAMRAEQLAAVAGLEADNDLMNLIATVATFTVAFVVPSAGLFVFQALRSAPREVRTLQLKYDRLSHRSNAMAKEVSREAEEIREALRAGDPSPHHSRIERSMRRFGHIASFNNAQLVFRNEYLEANEIVDRSIHDLGARSDVQTALESRLSIVADRHQLESVVTELLTNALTHGAAPVGVSTADVDGNVEIRVIDHGKGLLEVETDALIQEQHFELRENTLRGTYGFGLIASRRAMEAMGGSLRYERTDGQTHLVASLPEVQTDSASHDQQLGENELPFAA